jgi:hypothetical protein
MLRRNKKRLVGSVVLLWLAGVGLVARQFMSFERRPGKETAVSSSWPNESTLRPIAGQSTLVMIVHPKCPCSGASLDELADLVLKSPNSLRGYILFEKPEGVPSSWPRSPLWQKASGIPGMIPVVDSEEKEAPLFGASTSGHVFLYDAQGVLQFSGGITSGRGTRGESAGKASLFSYGDRGIRSFSRTPVFGCPLVDSRQR